MAQVVFGNFEYGGEIDPFPLTQFGWKSSFKELVEKGMGLPNWSETSFIVTPFSLSLAATST